MTYAVTIERLDLNAIVDLQGGREAISNWVESDFPVFPDLPNTSSQLDDLSLYWIAPERWLLRAPIEKEKTLIALSKPQIAPADISVVLVSDTIKFFRITGEDAGQIVSFASSIDWHDSVFPHNGVSYTDIFGIKGLLVKHEQGFDIGVESSYADMIEDYFDRAVA